MSVEEVSPGIIKVELSSDPEVCKAKLHESLDFYWEREDPVKALKVVSGVAFATALRLQDGDANVSIFIEAKKQDQTIAVEKYGDSKVTESLTTEPNQDIDPIAHWYETCANFCAVVGICVVIVIAVVAAIDLFY